MEESRTLFHTHGLRCTRQRDLLFGALRATKCHPTAEELFQAVKDQDAGLSLATVYNTLDAFTKCGLVRRIATAGAGAARYDADLAPHVHLVHGDGRITDVPEEVGRLILKRLRAEDLKAVEEATGVSVDHVSVQVMAKRCGGGGELV